MAVFGYFSQGRQEDVTLRVTVSGTNITGWALDSVFRRRSMGAVYFGTSGIIVSGTIGGFTVGIPGYVFSGVDPVNYWLDTWRNSSGVATYLAGDHVVLLPSTKRSG